LKALDKYLNSVSREKLLQFILIIEFLWIVIWSVAWLMEGQLVMDFFIFIAVFNVLTLLPFPMILKNKSREYGTIDDVFSAHEHEEQKNGGRDLWEKTTIGFYFLVNLLLMVFIGWVMIFVENS